VATEPFSFVVRRYGVARCERGFRRRRGRRLRPEPVRPMRGSLSTKRGDRSPQARPRCARSYAGLDAREAHAPVQRAPDTRGARAQEPRRSYDLSRALARWRAAPSPSAEGRACSPATQARKPLPSQSECPFAYVETAGKSGDLFTRNPKDSRHGIDRRLSDAGGNRRSGVMRLGRLGRCGCCVRHDPTGSR
jgi:hypothetical protein